MRRPGPPLIAAILIVAALSVSTLVMLQPHWLVKIIAASSPDVLFFADTREPVVALTIDDGPDPHTTPRILEVLERNGARATFFLISERMPGNEALVEAIVQAKHELGNHMTKDEPSIRLSASEFEADFLEADAALSRFGPTRWMRPGSGWYNDTMLSVVRKYGYRCALASIYPFDALIPVPGFAAFHILRAVRPGSVIALHDGGSRGHRTAVTLERILPVLRERGFRVVTLSELGESQAAGVAPQLD